MFLTIFLFLSSCGYKAPSKNEILYALPRNNYTLLSHAVAVYDINDFRIEKFECRVDRNFEYIFFAKFIP